MDYIFGVGELPSALIKKRLAFGKDLAGRNK